MAPEAVNKEKIFISIVLLVLTISVVAVVFLFVSQANPDRSSFPGIPALTGTEEEKKAAEPGATCPLDGLPTTPEAAARRPVAVMVENSPAARPQTGLSKADFVVEALAEGGVTRFMAIYVHNEVEEVGPVRSARPYYVQIAQGFRALFAHVGGSKEATRKIRLWGLADLDQFFNDSAFWRTKARPSPHNMYTSTPKLREAARQKGFTEEGLYQGFTHKPEESFKNRPESQTISVDFSYPQYKVRYEYDRRHNAYKRFIGETAHVDTLSGEQLMPKNVAVIYVPTSAGEGSTLDIDLNGEGNALVFRDGISIGGTWEKPTVNSQILFYDANGSEIALNPGQIWLEVVKTSTNVSYQ